MRNFSEKRAQALEACKKVLSGIEDGTITVSASLLLCKRISRLLNDLEGQEWLSYEYGGYPTPNGISRQAWNIGVKHGRRYWESDTAGNRKEHLFIELCGELEASIESKKTAIRSYTTQGFSVSGDYATLATYNMTSAVSRSINQLLQSINLCERRLSILKSQYYDYASKWYIELQFGNTAKSVFEEYQERVDSYFSALPTTAIQKLNAVEELLEDGNPEHYAQVLTSCRRMWSEVSKVLFSEVLPGYSDKVFKTKSGKEIDVSGDHDNNKMVAVIETLQTKATKNTLVGSEILYLIDWIEQINSSQSKGVHHEVTKEQAMQCIIHTYIALGDILSLKADAENVTKDDAVSG